MNRKKFIEQLALATAALAVAPQLMVSCKKEKLFGDSSFQGEVIVVGAGAAGLYAAYLLNLQGVSVKVLEASSRIGGRIKTLDNFGNFPIELGAETILGQRSFWYDMILQQGAPFLDDTTSDLFYFNGALQTEIESTQNTFFNAMTAIVNGVGAYTGGDVTAEAYGNISGLSDNVAHIFNALIANIHGTSTNRIGMFGLRERTEKWTAGSDQLMLKDRSMLSILETQMNDILNRVSFNTQVKAVDYSAGKIIVSDQNNMTHACDRVILTVPISVLKEGDIDFIPALSQSKLAAMQRIGFDRAMKIILKFDAPVWPAHTGSIYGPGFIPQYWPTAAGGRSNVDNVLTAFVAGEKAEQLAVLGDQLMPTLLNELDNLLGDATSHYVDAVVQDWGTEEFIRGGFSYGLPGTGNAREVLAQPIAGKLYFAGEATHSKGHHATVHGAMETALKAVTDILGIG